MFDYIKSILTSKKYITHNSEEENTFNFYMGCRWISMYSPMHAKIVNECCNKYAKIFTTKEDAYTFMFNIIPQSPYKKITYIKKAKKDKEKEAENIDRIANTMELSQREILDLMSYENT